MASMHLEVLGAGRGSEGVGAASGMEAHAAALRRRVEGEVRFGRHDRMLYATDASLYQVEPIGVVVPANEDDVVKVVEYCRENMLPILPRGGGTSLAGQCVNRAVVIDFSANCRGISFISPKTMACGVQPGITVDDLNDALRPYKLFFAPDPATARQANVGGCIGNNAAGTRSIRYGRTAENLEAVDVLLSTGEEMNLARGSGSDPWYLSMKWMPARVTERLASKTRLVRRLAVGVIDIVRRHERLIRERFPKTLRRNAGYALDMMLANLDEAAKTGRDPLETLNLAHLVCGSEGTLAVTTGAVLKLHPLPTATGLAVAGFESLDAAMESVEAILTLKPSAVELLDDMILGLAEKNHEYRRYVELMPGPSGGAGGGAKRGVPGARAAAVLYVEFQAGDGGGKSGRGGAAGMEEVRERLRALEALLAKVSPGAGVVSYTEAGPIAQALKLRKAGEPLLHGIVGKRKPVGFVEDNAVPVEHLPRFVREFRRIVEGHGTKASFYAHASVGVLHVRPLLDVRDEGDKKRMEAIAVEVADLAKSLGGVMSGEHGDGRSRGPLLERYYGRELMGAFREVKRLFDPLNLLNPGNIVEPGPIESIHEQTRYDEPTEKGVGRAEGGGAGEHGEETYFDYGEDGSFAHAVERCNGAGVCRKKSGGTMCPSYMATLDERHSTRGRGNALRLAISGQFGERSAAGGAGRPAWNDAETLATLDLCLSCKACKSECPSNVDMAQYKAEYLAKSYEATGGKGWAPWRAKMLADVRRLNRFGSMVSPAANRVMRSGVGRGILNRVLGLDVRRSLPEAAPSLWRLMRRRGREAAGVAADAPVVVLFADCFTAYNEPGIGLFAIDVLEVLGYRVVVPDAGCCGRAMISTGCLAQAQRTIAATARRLMDEVARERAVGVVVCEPSCAASLRDDWLQLRLDDVSRGAREDLAKRTYLVEEFIDREWEAHPRRPMTSDSHGGANGEGTIAIHGHCHQKALWGAESSAGSVRRFASAAERVKVLDTGCCGMAGAFGLTADHYDLSMKIGEQMLFPAARGLGKGDVLLAPGTSCRHQIRDGVAGVQAVHPIEWIAGRIGRNEARAR